LTPEQKKTIFRGLDNKITKSGSIQITVQSERSQFQNKQAAIKKFHNLLVSCFAKKKKRIKTKPSNASKEKRILLKKLSSERKKRRAGFSKKDFNL
jgi:ribosome-associated protein